MSRFKFDLNDSDAMADKVTGKLKQWGIKSGIFFGVLILGLIVFKMFSFTVHETEQVVVTKLSKVDRIIVNEMTPEMKKAIQSHPKLSEVEIIEGKGLFWKTPFIENVESYTHKLLTYDTDPREITTLDKKRLILDNYAQWRIENPALFKMTMKNERKAHTKLDDLIYSTMNEYLGRTDAHTLIADKEFVFKMQNEITGIVNERIQDYGMEVVDIRVKKTDPPNENKQSIYKRMETERHRIATKYRSEGEEEAQKTRSEAQKEATIIEAKAYEEAETIRGQGDAEALQIYANAFNQDPEFYQFYRTLQTYKKTIGQNDSGKPVVIEVPASSDFAKYLFKISVD